MNTQQLQLWDANLSFFLPIIFQIIFLPVSMGADKAAALNERPRLSFLSLISWSFVSAAF